ncbi:nitroreductase family protein [Streptomyces sp. ACA25]|uniref:Acg family FMN-binding oxidoreductase n=1 Tax=Streptomyces sp. ACA25 TaxID=3022596 RepID=UPI002307AA76|nr:nitroreductase family protein [Streptomyces sp. ACA25]MDB1087429.1 nitroreductase family protein [Streptomyces sp. ACA25]
MNLYSRPDPVPVLVGQAVRAPSSHNTQPWIFRRTDSGVTLHTDRSRALPVNDPAGRERVISAGAALLNLRVAALRHGLDALVEAFPDPADDSLLARVTLTERREPAPGDPDLYEAIARRHTCRRPFAARPVPEAVLRAAREAAEREGALMMPVPHGQRARVAALVEEGDRRQFATRAWRRELAFWMRPRRSGDGLAVPTALAPLLRTAFRSLDLGARTGACDAALVRAAPALLVITTDTDTRPAWLATGQALQRALLVLAAEGVLAGYANQPCQVGDPLRARLRDAVSGPDGGHPQLLLSAGYPRGKVSGSPRRPLADVLDP